MNDASTNNEMRKGVDRERSGLQVNFSTFIASLIVLGRGSFY